MIPQVGLWPTFWRDTPLWTNLGWPMDNSLGAVGHQGIFLIPHVILTHLIITPHLVTAPHLVACQKTQYPSVYSKVDQRGHSWSHMVTTTGHCWSQTHVLLHHLGKYRTSWSHMVSDRHTSHGLVNLKLPGLSGHKWAPLVTAGHTRCSDHGLIIDLIYVNN